MSKRRSMGERQFIATSLALLAALAVIGHCAGCGVWGERAKIAAEASLYERELDECLREGRAARSLAVYMQCAHEADVRHGVADGGAE